MKYYCFKNVDPAKFNHWQIVILIHDHNYFKECISDSVPKCYTVSKNHYEAYSERVLEDIMNFTININSKTLENPTLILLMKTRQI